MKKVKVLSVFLLAYFFFNSFSVKATHLMGSDMGWQSLGGDSFLVTITIYRDCQGIPLSDQDFTVKDCKLNTISLTTTATKKFAKDITPVCKSSCTQCSKKPNQSPGNTSCKFQYGIEMFVYQQKLNINKKNNRNKCCTFYLSWENCCRNIPINTGASGESFHVESVLHICMTGGGPSLQDNSPAFSFPPVTILPLMKPIYLNFHAQDIDVDKYGNRDSLSYSIYKTMQYGATSVGGSPTYTTWNTPYSYDKPLKFDSFPYKNAIWSPPSSYGGFHFDTLTGTLFFRPMATASTVMGVQVDEYRKDSLGIYHNIGTIRRDVQIIVYNDTANNVPTITGIDSTSKTDTFLTVGKKICFNIYTNDADTTDSTNLGCLTSLYLRGAKITIDSTTPHNFATFCWTPTAFDISTFPYELAFYTRDNHCPLPGNANRSIWLHVVPNDSDTLMVTPLMCNKFNFAATAKIGGRIASYLWTGDDGLYSTSPTFIHQYKKAGIYKYYLKVSNGYGLSHTDSGTITASGPGMFTVLPNDTMVCPNTNLRISSVVKGGVPPYSYFWTTGYTSPVISPLISKDTVIALMATDSALCSSSDTMHVKTFPKPATPSIVTLGVDTLKCSTKASFYIWYRDSIKISDTSQIIYAASSGKYQVQIMDTNGCVSSLSSIITGISNEVHVHSIHIYPNPTTGILTIEIPGIKEAQISIVNVTGQVQFQSVINEKTELNLHTLSKGIYLLRIQSKDGVLMDRIIKQ